MMACCMGWNCPVCSVWEGLYHFEYGVVGLAALQALRTVTSDIKFPIRNCNKLCVLFWMLDPTFWQPNVISSHTIL